MINLLIVFFAKYAIVLSILGIVLYFFSAEKLDKKKFLILFFISSFFSLVVARVFSLFIYNPRPFVVGHFTPLFSHIADNGFPSDHTLLAAAIAFVVFVRNKKWGIILFVIALLVGFSRVLAGVHHISDVMGSVFIAGAIVFICSSIKLLD